MLRVYTLFLILFRNPLVSCETTDNLSSCSPYDKINGECKSGEQDTKDHSINKNVGGYLTPFDLPKPRVFTDWDNSTISLPLNPNQVIATGSIDQNKIKGKNSFSASFSVLPQIVSRETVGEILSILRFGNASSDFQPENYHGQTAVDLDSDVDTVDAMPTQEIYLDNRDLRAWSVSKDYISVEEEFGEKRTSFRRQLKERLDPILEGIITPFVMNHFSKDCAKGGKRNCTVCESLIRRYRIGERISHAPHYDRYSLVTVVISFSDYDRDYTGGLYVSTEDSKSYYIGLNRGDAVIHQGDLYHGVNVLENTDESGEDHIPERWSWILWYRDSDTCKLDYASEWFKSCAEEGNPKCELLQSTRVDDQHEMIDLTIRSCHSGNGAACVKMARAYTGALQTSLISFDFQKAYEYYLRAIKMADHPDGYYGFALMILFPAMQSGNVHPDDPRIIEAIQNLEHASYRGHPYAMFNLGITHFFGYGYPKGGRNQTLAVQWFHSSGLPEGFAMIASHFMKIGKVDEGKEFQKRATSLGYGAQWRKSARESSGTGGSPGVSINLPWPPLIPDGRRPPQY